ncbi:hypothetical protein L207DRAFT_610250 [Hyaloscypha variabilis F]|uniref:Aminoglycoside phosphotransferase domain-containing protein n=1 Tax=Hyaloscypha variabilis (strain UAMH 11265 / GT02V1 / F) TaxID=1149755 RepID=A0A2J6R177_HYAVF|nr:hypothetical protein L207DRAFT_610250 [Hyaloscypha variabilis F]
MANRNVSPSTCLLDQIFGNDQPTAITILLQNWNKCIFRADFPDERPSCIARLEAEDTTSDTFVTVAALQEVTRTVIPDLVPPTYQLGRAQNEEGRKFQYSVIGLMEGDTLEEVWEKMGDGDRVSVVAEVTSAVAKVHRNSELLDEIQQLGVLGGPSTGFLNSGSKHLNALLEKRTIRKPFCSVITSSNGQDTIVESNFKDLGSLIIKGSETSAWVNDAVFCHNDLTPRNILIQTTVDKNGVPSYKLAGIIDWELSGFYPASYELSLQDTYLSLANRHISFYLLLKENMAKLAPRAASQVVLMRAMELIYESQQRCLLEGTSISAHIRKQFLVIGQLVKDEDPYLGWTRAEGPTVDIDKTTFQRLEDEAIEQMQAKKRAGT